MMYPRRRTTEWIKYGGIIQTIYAIEVDHWDLHQSCCAGGINTVRDLTNNLFYMAPLSRRSGPK